MFESLNTTGEPLTVLETFRPKVIESEELDKYENSDSRKYMRTIEEYLGQFNVAKKRQDETSKLLTSFALAESGKKLPSDSSRSEAVYEKSIRESTKQRRKA